MISITYVSRMRFLSDKAHVYNTAKTCEAMMATGKARVTLVSTDDSLAGDREREAYFQKHGIGKRFTVESLFSAANRFRDSRFRLVNWLEVILANVTLILYLHRTRALTDVVYFRDPFAFFAIVYARIFLRKPVFFEIHAVLSRSYSQFMNNFLARMSSGTVSIAHALSDYYRVYNANGITSFCAAAEPERFAAIALTKEDLRQKLGLPPGKIILGYSGNLYKTGNNDPYGLDDIIRAMPLLDNNVLFMAVGKKGSETAELEELAEKEKVRGRVMFIPWVPKERIAEYLLASDILLIPAAGARIGNSPTKMFEYLVSGRPIVAARTQAIAEVLADGRNSILVDYKKPEEWAFALRRLISDQALGQKLSEQALADGRHFTWAGRGGDIIEFISKTIGHE